MLDKLHGASVSLQASTHRRGVNTAQSAYRCVCNVQRQFVGRRWKEEGSAEETAATQGADSP